MSRQISILGASVALTALVLMTGGVSASARLKTAPSAIGCFTSDKLQQAEEAIKAHDRTQMDTLGCFPILSGTAALRIEGGANLPLWHLRLDPDGPSPLDIWARPSSFLSE